MKIWMMFSCFVVTLVCLFSGGVEAGVMNMSDESLRHDLNHDYIIVGKLKESKLENIVYEGKFYAPDHVFPKTEGEGFQGHLGLFSGTIEVIETIQNKKDAKMTKSIRVTWVEYLDINTKRQLPSSCPHLGNTTAKEKCVMLLSEGRLGIELRHDYRLDSKQILLDAKKRFEDKE